MSLLFSVSDLLAELHSFRELARDMLTGFSEQARGCPGPRGT